MASRRTPSELDRPADIARGRRMLVAVLVALAICAMVVVLIVGLDPSNA